MARITVTDLAKSHLRDLLKLHPYERPVLTIFLDRAQKDLHRGVGGEVVWSTVGTAGWKANVLDWADMPPDFSIRPVGWEGIELAVTSQAELLHGELVVDCDEGGFRVEASAI